MCFHHHEEDFDAPRDQNMGCSFGLRRLRRTAFFWKQNAQPEESCGEQAETHDQDIKDLQLLAKLRALVDVHEKIGLFLRDAEVVFTELVSRASKRRCR